jgi:hypothetical protein
MHRCKGCGVMLQTTEPEVVGYISVQHLEKGLCQRCFKIKQYSEFHYVDIDNASLVQLISGYDKEKDLLCLVVDLSDLRGTALLELAKSLQGHPLIVVVNKIDIILRQMRRYDLWEAQLASLFETHGIVVEAFFFVSAKAQLGIKRLIAYYEASKYDKIKIIGCANVGKSSLITALFNDSEANTTAVMPTVFMTPGTTLEELSVDWRMKRIYDTPGIMQAGQLTYYLTPQAIKAIALHKPVKPRNYHIYEPQTFFIGGYVQVNVYPKTTDTVTFFIQSNVPIHRTKLARDDTFYQRHVGTLLSPPTTADLARNERLLLRTQHNFALKQQKRDIVVAGLGWLSLKAGGASVEVLAPEGVHVYEQEAIV